MNAVVSIETTWDHWFRFSDILQHVNPSLREVRLTDVPPLPWPDWPIPAHMRDEDRASAESFLAGFYPGITFVLPREVDLRAEIRKAWVADADTARLTAYSMYLRLECAKAIRRAQNDARHGRGLTGAE